MCRSACHPDAVCRHADRDARAVDDHQVVFVADSLQCNKFASLLGDVDRLHALAAAMGLAVLFEVGTFAEAVLADYQDIQRFERLLCRVDADHADDIVVFLQVDAANTRRITPDGAGFLFFEAAALALVAGQQDLAVAAGQGGADQGVAFAQVDGDDAIGARAGIGFQQGLLDRAVGGGQNQVVAVGEFLVFEVLYVEVGLDAVFRRKGQDVLDGAAFRGLGTFRDLVDLEPEALAALCEEHQRTVHVGYIDMLDEIFVAGGAALGADAAAALRAVFGQAGALDVAVVRDGDDHVLVRVEVFGVEVFGCEGDLGAARVTVFFFQFLQLVLDDAHLHLLAFEDLLVIMDHLFKLVVFGLQLVAFQAGELAEAHLHDGVSLFDGESETFHQSVACVGHAAGGTDQGDDLVDDVERLEQAFEDMGALEGFVELEAGAAHDHFVAVAHIVFDELLEVELLRAAVHQGDVVDREARLERCELEQAVEHHVRRGALFQFDDDAHAVAVAFVVDIGNTVEFLGFHELGDAFDQLPLVDGVGNLRHNDGLAAG